MKKQRNIIGAVCDQLWRSVVLATYKTKPGTGRELVTVGPYRSAIPSEFIYALYIGTTPMLFKDAGAAARAFIYAVGRDDAWNAAQGRGRPRNPA